MQYLDIEPNFDNFWSLYSFTTSTRSGNRGFFYLSAKPDCRYLDTLKSNVGAWLDHYIFVRPPRAWPFNKEWSKYKPVPRMSGGGLEGDQINRITAFKYDTKKLLIEKVLRLSGLSPAPLHIDESLDSLIMSSRNTMRLKAATNKLRKGKQVVDPADLPSSSPIPAPSRAPVPASSANQQPILVDSEETPSAPVDHHGYNSSELELNLDDVSGGRGQGEPVEPSGSSKSKPHHSKSLRKMALEVAEKTSQVEERDRFLRLAQLTSRWEDNKEALRGDQSQGDRASPRWDSSSSSMLFSEAGGESFDLYNSFTSLRDQSSLLMNNPIQIGEYGVHAQLQALTFFRSLSLKCTNYRRSFIISDQKVQDLKAQLAERDRLDLKHADEMLILAEKVKSLEGQLAEAEKAKEVALAEGTKEGFDAGREVGLVEGHKQGLEEGQAGRITIEEHHKIMADSRMSTVRDFLKTNTFTTALEIKSVDSFAKGYKTCEAQIEKLGGFQESFDRSQLDITLDGELQPYLAEPDLKDDEFAALLEELEAEADA
ncbi:UNVERIFIED_CONTAM: hypothetical protein Sindi_2021300 [Sesamum indicum]